VAAVADRSRIEWTDRTWNPVMGCTKVSPGCEHCYAEAIAHRFAGSAVFPRGFAVTLHPERVSAPLRWRRPCRVFVNSMSDLFHPQVPEAFLVEVFAVMAATPGHTYQVLTKRPGRLRALLHSPGFRSAVLARAQTVDPDRRWPGWPVPNVWLGVSVEDDQRAGLRIPVLLNAPAAVRFVSCEPLLGPVWLRRRWLTTPTGTGGIDWVIVGGESGPGARPMHPAWARSLREQCYAAGVAFFFKQWGAWAPTTPGHPQDGKAVVRVGKKAAGRHLDGRTWDQFPPGVTP
jgi:protein gp37